MQQPMAEENKYVMKYTFWLLNSASDQKI